MRPLRVRFCDQLTRVVFSLTSPLGCPKTCAGVNPTQPIPGQVRSGLVQAFHSSLVARLPSLAQSLIAAILDPLGNTHERSAFLLPSTSTSVVQAIVFPR